MHSYQHNIKTFNNATMHLTHVERSLYRCLIELYYDTEQPLPADDFDRLARRVMATSDEEKAALHFVLDEYFELTGDVYTHDYCDRLIEGYRNAKSAKAKAGRASAAARAKKAEDRKQQRKKRKERNSTGVEQPLNSVGAQGQHEPTNQEPLTINQEPLNNTPPSPPAVGAKAPDDLDISFDRFWDAYPRKEDKANARKAWRKLKPTDALVDKIIANVSTRVSVVDWCPKTALKFIPLATTYLNGSRWNDEPIPNRAKPELRPVGGGDSPAGKVGFIDKHTDKSWAKGL